VPLILNTPLTLAVIAFFTVRTAVHVVASLVFLLSLLCSSPFMMMFLPLQQVQLHFGVVLLVLIVTLLRLDFMCRHAARDACCVFTSYSIRTHHTSSPVLPFISALLEMPTIAGIKLLVKDITALSNVLPLSIPQGTKSNKIWNVMKVEERETAHKTFNMRFDAMFGEDCRDSGGRLHHISRGKFGIACVCSYLAKVDWSDHFPLDLVEIKLQRLITELRYIWCVAGLNYPFAP
jgi:hypothetical protein